MSFKKILRNNRILAANSHICRFLFIRYSALMYFAICCRLRTIYFFFFLSNLLVVYKLNSTSIRYCYYYRLCVDYAQFESFTFASLMVFRLSDYFFLGSIEYVKCRFLYANKLYVFKMFIWYFIFISENNFLLRFCCSIFSTRPFFRIVTFIRVELYLVSWTVFVFVFCFDN